MDTLDDKHTLAIGDVVSYRVVEDDDPASKLIVADSGDLEIPLAKGENGAVQLLGRYPALGRTCKKLAWVLKGDLEKDYYKKATVILAIDAMSHTRGRINVYGAVRAPGPQEIPSDEEFTLSKAILRAGGPTEYAARTVRITRKDPKDPKGGKAQQIFVNIEKILQEGKHEGDITLQADDFIFVDERSIRGF